VARKIINCKSSQGTVVLIRDNIKSGSSMVGHSAEALRTNTKIYVRQKRSILTLTCTLVWGYKKTYSMLIPEFKGLILLTK
jgi:hypothetical protein